MNYMQSTESNVVHTVSQKSQLTNKMRCDISHTFLVSKITQPENEGYVRGSAIRRRDELKCQIIVRVYTYDISPSGGFARRQRGHTQRITKSVSQRLVWISTVSQQFVHRLPIPQTPSTGNNCLKSSLLYNFNSDFKFKKTKLLYKKLRAVF